MNTKDNTAGDAIATPQPEKSFAAAVDFAQLIDEAGRPVLLYGPWVEQLRASGQRTLTLTVSLIAIEPQRRPLGLREAARLLLEDFPWLDIIAAEARIRRACEKKKIACDGSGTARKIDAVSFDAWRLAQRDAESDRADNK